MAKLILGMVLHYTPLKHSSHVNHFGPEFLKWSLPSLNLDMSIDANRGFS